jgi:YidC/Oxa1 family membrane protein insertase
MNNQQNPFMDKKGLLAIVIIGAFFFFWQSYMTKTYPQKPVAAPAEQAKGTTANETAAKNTVGATVEVAPNQDNKAANVSVPEKLLSYEGQKLKFNVSNVGMGLKNVTLKDYTDRKGDPIQLGVSDQASLFEMRLNKTGAPIVFNVEDKGNGLFIGTAEAGGMSITREIKYNEERRAFESRVQLKNVKEDDSVSIVMPEKIEQHEGGGGFFSLSKYEHQDFFVIGDDKKDQTINFSSAKNDVRQDFNAIELVAIASQYFTTAAMDNSSLKPELKVHADLNKKEAQAQMIYRPVAATASMDLAQTFFVGPKSIDVLDSIHPEFSRVINLGSFLGVIGRPMLLFMKMAHDWVSNWGLAIIMLTLLVRLIVLPLYVMSTKSMKAMQKVQPQIQALKEKYKEDPVKMNQEMMALMRQNGANPLGGCLPMILQIPIFFALFRVIGSSVELYQAPFFGWIHDLSVHDPFYVLPVLMGLTMFFQQKLTPTTMDPAQAKIMMFMPIIFSVFMLNLPSGLTLYMFVSGLFGVTQQVIMMRDKSRVPAVKKT